MLSYIFIYKKMLLTISCSVIECFCAVKSANSFELLQANSPILFNITLCLISQLWKCLWWKAFCFLKEKCVIPNLQSQKNTTIPFNALSFKAEKIKEIPFDTFYSKLKDLFQFRKHERTFRRKKNRIQRKKLNICYAPLS